MFQAIQVARDLAIIISALVVIGVAVIVGMVALELRRGVRDTRSIIGAVKDVVMNPMKFVTQILGQGGGKR